MPDGQGDVAEGEATDDVMTKTEPAPMAATETETDTEAEALATNDYHDPAQLRKGV